MARNLDLAALRSFIAVSETGGVTRAAQRLNLTQSAVSMQIKRLEESLDVGLLSREGRGVALTPKGEEMLSHARRIISVNDEIIEKMLAPEPVGQVNFGVPHDIVYPHVPIVLRRFRDHAPGVRINLISSTTANLFTQFDAGKADVILTTEHGLRNGGQTLETRRLIWVGALGGRAWRRSQVPLAFERRCAFRKPTQEALEAVGLRWESAVDTEYLDTAFATIAADLGVCTMLRGAETPAMEEINHGGALPELPEFKINIYSHSGSHAQMLAEMVRQEYAASPSLARAV